MGKASTWIFVLAALVVVPAAQAAAPLRPAVLELYTSEGCSSCPPAETLVNELARRPDVLALSFHVDYWDGLGWRDHYSLALATERQRRYAQTLHLASIYTPQVVVDGSRDLVGSRRDAVIDAVATPREGIPIALDVSAGMLHIGVGAGVGHISSDVVLVGFLRQATTQIGRGENAGRTLQESNIVRAVTLLGAWQGKPRDFELAVEKLPQEVTDVAVLIQSAGQGEIVGAATQFIR